MKSKKNIPCIYYLYLHRKIWEMSGGGIVSTRKVKKYLFQWKIPSKIRPLLIKELLILGLIEKESKNLIKINQSEFNLENLNSYYQILGIF